MRLVTKVDGHGRVPAVEVLRATPFIRDCIENKEKTKLIPSAIAAGTSQYGMQTFDQSLYYLYRAGLVSFEEALRQATNPDDLKLKVDGIQSTADLAHEALEQGLAMAPDHAEGESPYEFA
jgi:twitching motility protein PilT